MFFIEIYYLQSSFFEIINQFVFYLYYLNRIFLPGKNEGFQFNLNNFFRKIMRINDIKIKIRIQRI